MASSSEKSELNSSASFSSNSDEVDDIFITCCAPNGCTVPSPVNLHQVCLKFSLVVTIRAIMWVDLWLHFLGSRQ